MTWTVFEKLKGDQKTYREDEIQISMWANLHCQNQTQVAHPQQPPSSAPRPASPLDSAYSS